MFVRVSRRRVCLFWCRRRARLGVNASPLVAPRRGSAGGTRPRPPSVTASAAPASRRRRVGDYGARGSRQNRRRRRHPADWRPGERVHHHRQLAVDRCMVGGELRAGRRPGRSSRPRRSCARYGLRGETRHGVPVEPLVLGPAVGALPREGVGVLHSAENRLLVHDRQCVDESVTGRREGAAVERERQG